MTTPVKPPTFSDPRLHALYLVAKRRAFIRRRMEMLLTIAKALEAAKGNPAGLS